MDNHESKRELILEAASKVVMRLGVSAMTLEAVAKEAGVSKGGLLYHFRSKNVLIEGMMERLEAEFARAIEAEVEREQATENKPTSVGRWLRAYVRVCTTSTHEIDAFYAALLVAFNSNPELLSSLRQSDKKWQKLIENDGIEPTLATIIKLAADSCWLSGLFGLDAGFNSKAKLKALQTSLLDLVESGIQKAA